jgi:hypothetical protein
MTRHALFLLAVATLGAFAIGCDVDVTKEGSLPNVTAEPGRLPEVKVTKEGELPDIDISGGELPKVDVEPADVDVETKTKTVEVPDVDVDVDTDKETIEVPDVDINDPDQPDDDN